MDRRKALISLCSDNSTDLYYLDSRGSRTCDENSKTLFNLITSNFSSNSEDLIIEVRPLELTTFASLIEYLYCFNGKISKLVTNVGFVDFTPKKRTVLEEHRSTCDRLGIEYEEKIVEPNFMLSNGESCDLSIISYKDSIIESLVQEFKKIPQVVFLSTPINFDNQNSWQRKRPPSFFQGIMETNSFLRKASSQVPNASLIDLGDIKTYDGVHWDSEYHLEVFKRIKDHERRRNKT